MDAGDRIRLLSESEVKEILGVSSRTLRRWRNDGMLSYVKINGRIKYPEEYIQEVIKAGFHKAEHDITDRGDEIHPV
jgi:predicted site-specific integrase-resolvase